MTWASLVAQRLKSLPTMWETRVQSLGRKDPLEEEMVTHFSILAWSSPAPRPGPRARARGGEAEEGAAPRGL